MEDGAKDLLKTAINQLMLPARAYDRILEVARTIAELDGGEEKIQLHHIAEAINYRVWIGDCSGEWNEKSKGDEENSSWHSSDYFTTTNR